MDEFLKTSRKYTESLLNVNQGKRLKAEWRKVTWSLYKTEDVRKLHANLQGHISAFQMYTFAITWQGISRTEQKVIENSETSQRIELKVLEMFTILKDLQNNLPKTMGYSWEGCVSDQKPAYLEDALGRTVFLPRVLCRSKDTFHDVLEVMFRSLPGHKKISEKEYEVLDEAQGIIVKSQEWKSMVVPGARITISMLLKNGIFNLVFRTVNVARIVELPESPQAVTPVPHRQGKSAKGIITSALPERAPKKIQKQEREAPSREAWEKEIIDKEAKEESAFRRVHFQREIVRFTGAIMDTSACYKHNEPDVVWCGTELQEASWGGNLRLVQKLLSELADVNTLPMNGFGRTALQAAAGRGHLEVVKLLLLYSADVNAFPARWCGRTALQAAVGGGYLEVIKLLLSHSADVNDEPAWSLETTALQAAAEGGHPEVVKLLLAHAADVNAEPTSKNGSPGYGR